MNNDQILKIDTGTNTIKTFEIKELVLASDKVMNQPTIPYSFENKTPLDVASFCNSLFETMFAHKGLGLSAPQMGIPLSVFVVGFDNTNKQVFINPEILELSPETDTILEGCLSHPGLTLNFPRAKWVKLKYYGPDGKEKETTYTGLTARIIQHEMEHLNGKQFIQNVSKLKLDIAKRKNKKRLKLISKK